MDDWPTDARDGLARAAGVSADELALDDATAATLLDVACGDRLDELAAALRAARPRAPHL